LRRFRVLKPSFCSQADKSDAVRGPTTATAQFVEVTSGTTELPEGIIHIYRYNTYNYNDGGSNANENSSLGQDANIPGIVREEESNDGKTVAVLAVPSHMAPSDFLTFVAPAVDSIAHLRMIRCANQNYKRCRKITNLFRTGIHLLIVQW